MTLPETAKSGHDDQRAVARRIDFAVPCLSCGYSLQGLDAIGRCPECNESIERSLRGRLLGNADRRWVRRVILGFDLFLLSFLARFILFVVSQIMTMIIPTMALTQLADALQVFGGIAGPLLALGSVFLITTPEPSRAGSGRTMAMLLRGAAVAVVSLRALSMSAIYLPAPMSTGHFQMAESAAFLIVVFGVFASVAAFAWRAALPNVAAQAQFMQWALPLGSILMFVVVAALSSGAGNVGVQVGLGFSLLAFGAAMTAFGVWAIALLITFRVRVGNHLDSFPG